MVIIQHPEKFIITTQDELWLDALSVTTTDFSEILINSRLGSLCTQIVYSNH